MWGVPGSPIVKLLTENIMVTGLEAKTVALITTTVVDPGGGGGDGGDWEGGLLAGDVWVVDAPPSELSLPHAEMVSIDRMNSMHMTTREHLRIITIACIECME